MPRCRRQKQYIFLLWRCASCVTLVFGLLWSASCPHVHALLLGTSCGCPGTQTLFHYCKLLKLMIWSSLLKQVPLCSTHPGPVCPACLLLGEAGTGLRGETGAPRLCRCSWGARGEEGCKGQHQTGGCRLVLFLVLTLVLAGASWMWLNPFWRQGKGSKGGGVGLMKTAGRPSRARFAFGPLVRSAWPCPFPWTESCRALA